MKAASRAMTSKGCATSASGCAIGVGLASASVAKRSVVAAANLIVGRV